MPTSPISPLPSMISLTLSPTSSNTPYIWRTFRVLSDANHPYLDSDDDDNNHNGKTTIKATPPGSQYYNKIIHAHARPFLFDLREDPYPRTCSPISVVRMYELDHWNSPHVYDDLYILQGNFSCPSRIITSSPILVVKYLMAL